MSLIKFPGLNIEFNVPTIAFELFGINIYYYAICIVLGIIVALILCKISKEKFNIEFDKVLEIMFWAIIIGYIGARLYYVIFNLSKYLQEPSKILNFRDGGLAIYGGIIFAGIYIFIKCKKDKINFLDFCDYIIPFLAIAQSIGRWGNFFNKEAYGHETTNIFRMGIYNSSGEYFEVHPTFFYEAVGTFVIFIFLRILQKNRKFSGQILYVYILLYSFIRMFIEGMREDSLMFFGFRISQVLSLIFFVISSILLFKNNKKLIQK